MKAKYKSGDKVIIYGHEVTIEEALTFEEFIPLYKADRAINNIWWHNETDITPLTILLENLHINHEVVTNTVMHKSFKYCRNCKIEVV